MNSKFLTNLKAQAEENPVMTLAAGAAAATAVAKFVDAIGSVRSRNAYAKKMKHSMRKK